LRIYPVSLGCPKNQSVLEERLTLLINMGHEVVLDPSIADVAVVNTCAFVEPATIESISTVVSLRQDYPHLKIFFTGCVPQRYGKQMVKEELEEIDFIADPDNIEDWLTVFDSFPRGDILDKDNFNDMPFTLTFPYAYVYISKGCSSACSYCTIPSFKGPHVSIPIDEIVRKVTALEEAGYKEVVLVSQDVAAYGIDVGGFMLPNLLEELHRHTREILFRLLYLNPKYFRKKIIEEISHFERLVPYFDIPVQHIHSDILKMMNRGYTYENIVEILDTLYQYWTQPAVRTTLMIGFPGETDVHFQFLKDRIVKLPFDWIGVFKFLPEVGTPAYNMEQVPDKVKEERYNEIIKVVADYVEKRAYRWVGKVTQAIITEVISYDSDNVVSVGYPIFCAPEIDKVVHVINGDISDIGNVINVLIEDYNNDIYVARVR